MNKDLVANVTTIKPVDRRTKQPGHAVKRPNRFFLSTRFGLVIYTSQKSLVSELIRIGDCLK